MRSGAVDGFRSSTHICDGIRYGRCTNPDALRPIVPFAGSAQSLLDYWNFQRGLGIHQFDGFVVAMPSDSAFLVADNEGPLHQSKHFLRHRDRHPHSQHPCDFLCPNPDSVEVENLYIEKNFARARVSYRRAVSPIPFTSPRPAIPTSSNPR